MNQYTSVHSVLQGSKKPVQATTAQEHHTKQKTRLQRGQKHSGDLGWGPLRPPSHTLDKPTLWGLAPWTVNVPISWTTVS